MNDIDGHITQVASEEGPGWCAHFRGMLLVVGESLGEYNGCLGFPDVALAHADRDNLARGYRRKHPNWTGSKIEKAVQSAMKQARKKSSAVMPGYYSHNVERDAIASFLGELASAGPIILLLDDGGLVDPNAGGTRGLPDADRQPRISEGYSVRLNQMPIENGFYDRIYG